MICTTSNEGNQPLELINRCASQRLKIKRQSNMLDEPTWTIQRNPSDPNQNSTGASAAQSALGAADDRDLRVPYFCEENVWRLARRKSHGQTRDRYTVCFISNETQTVAMFRQKANSHDDDDHPIIWDYHVILLSWSPTLKQATVYDIDSCLPYPVSLEIYLRDSFTRYGRGFPPPYAPRFRLVPAELFLTYFTSDRSHMYNAATKTWNAPPPPYDCIAPTASAGAGAGAAPAPRLLTLQQYLRFDSLPGDMSATTSVPLEAWGKIVSLRELMDYDFAGER